MALLNVRPIDVPSPWQASLIPVPEFPIPQDKLLAYQEQLGKLRDHLTNTAKLTHSVVLQTWKLSSTHGGSQLEQHRDQWPMDIGFGVWPTRPSPQGWTETSIQDAAAAVYRGEEPDLPSHRILLLNADAQISGVAARQMQGFGAQLELFSSGTSAQILERGREVLLPKITERRFRKSKVYLPLIDARTLASAESAEQLTEWMCGTEVYLRESAEDKGILLIARRNIAELLSP